MSIVDGINGPLAYVQNSVPKQRSVLHFVIIKKRVYQRKACFKFLHLSN